MSKSADLAGYQIALKTALIEFTDGDDAIAIADAGVVTLLTTAVAKSEGGAVTTNIAQGLCKYWITYTQASDTVGDSFNHSSVTDVATGDDTLNITSDFSSAEHAANAQHMQEDGNAEMGFAVTEARAAGTIRIRGLQNNRGALHDGVFQAHSWGDLA